jgi:hypothetical protein
MLPKRFSPLPLRNPSTRPRANPPAPRDFGASAGGAPIPPLQRITPADLEQFLLAQRRASEAKRHLETIEQRILSRLVAGARVEPGVHAPKLGLIVE